MEIKILLPPEESKQRVINLKNYIDKTTIAGVEKTEVCRAIHGEGQMRAGDILNSVTTIIEAATETLVQLVKCLQKYVDHYRTIITIPTKNGNIELRHGRSMKPEEMKELVIAIQHSISYQAIKVAITNLVKSLRMK